MSHASPERSPGTDGLQVLVVEDEALIAMYMEDILIRLGCRVVKAGRITEGLQFIDTMLIDGAFLDVDVSGKSILPIAESLKSHEIPFVFVTGSELARVPAGFRDRSILPKPFAESRFAEVLAEFAAGAPMGHQPQARTELKMPTHFEIDR